MGFVLFEGEIEDRIKLMKNAKTNKQWSPGVTHREGEKVKGGGGGNSCENGERR